MNRKTILPIVLAVGMLTGCGQSAPPEVTFTAADRSVQTGPIRYCDIELTECEENDSAVAVLSVPVGQTVQISVPESVADTPWQVVFSYHKDGAPTGGRSEVFAPGTTQDYTLVVPEAGALDRLEVQQYGAPALVNGEPSFRIRAAWVLTANG